MGATHDSVVEFLYNTEFSKQAESHHAAWDIITRKNYWEPGEYLISIQVYTSRPEKVFSDNWGFKLTENDREILQLNAVATLREICTGKANYYYVYKD